MIRAVVVLVLVAAVLSWAAAGPARAQTAGPPQAIYDSFEALLGGREEREIYALPPERYWRATGSLQVRLAGGREFGLAPDLVALADDFGGVADIDISVQASAIAMMPEAGKAGDLTVLIVARPLGAEFAAGLGIDAEMRQRFADGRWPALFRFRRDDLSKTGRRSGIVLVADDLKSAEIETFLALAMVWTMGGASIGDELGVIVSIAGRPHLTERGRRVFALMYDPELTLGQPLDETRATARRRLGLPD
jgi:hypothetical protein